MDSQARIGIYVISGLTSYDVAVVSVFYAFKLFGLNCDGCIKIGLAMLFTGVLFLALSIFDAVMVCREFSTKETK